MSTPLESEGLPDQGPSRAFARALRVLATLSALMALIALWSTERARFPHDLQLAAESRARPGEQLALRAFLFRDIEAPEGPTLVSHATVVRLRDEAGRELAQTALTQTKLAAMEGQIQLPTGQTGHFTLEAESTFEGESLLCRRALEITPSAPAGQGAGRSAGPLQQRSLGRVRATSPAPVPDQLLVRVAGGACMPDLRCELLVWVGQPGASIRLRASPSVEPLAPFETAESEGVVSLWAIVHGPEAELTLEARRAGELVAERALRLPVGLGEVAIRVSESIVEPARALLELTPPPGRDFAIVDVFASGRWSATRTLPRHDHPPGAALSDWLAARGLVRTQARVDRFSSESSGARALYVRGPGEDDSSALLQIAAAVAREYTAGDEPAASWARKLPPFALAQPQRTAAFLLASLEELRLAVPSPLSGRPAQLSRHAHTQLLFRYWVAGALALSALVIGLSLGRRGFQAADQAQAILDEARSEDGARPVSRPRERMRGRLRALLLVLAVSSAFLAGALLIAAKALWF